LTVCFELTLGCIIGNFPAPLDDLLVKSHRQPQEYEDEMDARIIFKWSVCYLPVFAFGIYAIITCLRKK